MATFRTRNGRTQVQVRRQGSAPVTRTFASRKDAEEWAREMERQADRRGLPVNPAVLDRTTLAQVLVRFRDEVVPTTKSAEVDTYIINAFLRRPLAKVALSALTPGKFAQYRDERLREVSADTVQRELSVYQRALKKAMTDWELPLTVNPLSLVSKPKKAKGRNRRLVDGEQVKIMAAITTGMRRCRNPWIAPLVELALETSRRRSDLLKLEWANVDLERRVALLPDTKNGDDQTIALSRRAMEILDELRGKHPTRVFPISAEAVKCAWRRLRKRAGAEDLRFHDLRHEAISRFFEEKGLSIPEAALMSGHRDPRMLFRYTHLRAESIAERLD